MIMKKISLILAMLVVGLFLSTSTANAWIVLDNWTINLSGYGLGTFTNIDRLNPDGTSIINQ